MANMISAGPLTFSVTHHSLARDGIPVVVGGRGLDLLARLLEQPGEVVTSEELMRAGWGKLSVQPNNLPVQISALRKALGERPGGGSFIRAVAGRGYMFAGDVKRYDDERAPPGRSWPPAAVTSFVGRAAELTGLGAMLEQARLVTVVGAGGVGKTRLVQKLLNTMAQPWAGIDLALAADMTQVTAAIAGALGDVNATIDAIVARLRTVRLLLILDNAEHVAADLDGLLTRILAECPGVAIVVTSRIVLRVAGQAIFRLAPLEPPPASATTLQEIAGYACVTLFAERATAAQPTFVLSHDNCREVAEICRQLDGIALAIEMVAPRLRAMSTREIVRHLDKRFSLLSGSGPGVLPRQRTLATMLTWSWELLDASEQSALMRLATYRAPATLAALDGIGPDPAEFDAAMAPDVLDAITGLTDKSLATAEPSGAGTRFRLLQTTRDYVLAITPRAERRDLRGRHARFMADLFEDARQSWPAAPTSDWLDRNAAYVDDLREALEWSTGPEGDTMDAVRLVAASLPLWLELPGTPLGEMHGWFDRATPFLQRETPARDLAWFRIGQSWRATQFGDVRHRPIAKEAVEAARNASNGTLLGVALMRYGHTLMRPETMEQADEQFMQAERYLRVDLPGKWLCLVLIRRADTIVRLGRLDDGLRYYEEAIDLAQALEFRFGRVVSISNMTEVLYTIGERDQAIQQLRTLVTRTAPGSRDPAMATLAAHLCLADQTDAAFAAAADVATWAPVTGMDGPLAWAAEAVALLLARSGRLTGAATMSGYASRVLPAFGIRFGSRLEVYKELMSRLSAGLRPAERLSFEAAGAAWSLREAAAAITVNARCDASR